MANYSHSQISFVEDPQKVERNEKKNKKWRKKQKTVWVAVSIVWWVLRLFWTFTFRQLQLDGLWNGIDNIPRGFFYPSRDFFHFCASRHFHRNNTCHFLSIADFSWIFSCFQLLIFLSHFHSVRDFFCIFFAKFLNFSYFWIFWILTWWEAGSYCC